MLALTTQPTIQLFQSGNLLISHEGTSAVAGHHRAMGTTGRWAPQGSGTACTRSGSAARTMSDDSVRVPGASSVQFLKMLPPHAEEPDVLGRRRAEQPESVERAEKRMLSQTSETR
ncbi:unnamed protein product [Lampetra fluviatilis]